MPSIRTVYCSRLEYVTRHQVCRAVVGSAGGLDRARHADRARQQVALRGAFQRRGADLHLWAERAEAPIVGTISWGFEGF